MIDTNVLFPMEWVKWDDFAKWPEKVESSELVPSNESAATFKSRRLFGTKTFSRRRTVTNGMMESLNAKARLAERKAKGYAGVNDFMNMACNQRGDSFRYPLNPK